MMIVEDWFFLDGEWKHLAKEDTGFTIIYYCNGVKQTEISKSELREKDYRKWKLKMN